MGEGREQATKPLAPQGPFWSAEQQGSRTRRKKKLPRYPGWFSATFSGMTPFPVGPPPVGNGDLLAFWPVLVSGTWKWAKMGQKTTILLFPAGGGPTKLKSFKESCRKPSRIAWYHFFDKSAPSTRKLCFRVFRPGPEFLPAPKAQNGPKPH